MEAVGRSRKRLSRHHRMVTTQGGTKKTLLVDSFDGRVVGDVSELAARVGAQRDSGIDLLGAPIVSLRSDIEHEMRSATDKACIRLPEGMSGRDRRQALFLLSKDLGANTRVFADSSGDTHTIATILALRDCVIARLPELIIDDIEASRIRCHVDGMVVSPYLGKSGIPSSSSHLEPCNAKRINTGSKPSRERLVSDLPTVNELDRPESLGGEGDTKWRRSQGRFEQEQRELRRAEAH